MTEEDFRTLYEVMYPELLRFAQRQFDSHTAADAVSDAFTVAWDKRTEAPSGQAKCRGWVFGIAKNVVRREHQRRARKHHDNRFHSDHPHLSLVEDSSDAPAVRRDVGTWLYRQFNEAERELFEVSTIPGIDASTAAQLLEISTGTYYTRLSRLRSRIVGLAAESEQSEGKLP